MALSLSTLRGSFQVPLAGGDAGVAQTIDLIRRLVDEGVTDPVVNEYVLKILENVPPHNNAAEVRAIYDHVLQNFRFVMDPVGPSGPKETLRPARVILNVRAGDCDDINAVLLPSLLGSAGYATRLVTIAADPNDSSQFSHIYAEVEVFPGSNRWVPIDAARPNTQFASAPPFYFRKRIWSLTDSNYQDISGPRRLHGLSGYLALGQDASVPLIPQLTTGVAEIISAVRRQPFDPFAYPTTNPYASFQTPQSPAAVAPAAGYPATGGLSLTGGVSTPLLLVAVGLIALMLFKR